MGFCCVMRSFVVFLVWCLMVLTVWSLMVFMTIMRVVIRSMNMRFMSVIPSKVLVVNIMIEVWYKLMRILMQITVFLT